jgi:hypothetical protein
MDSTYLDALYEDTMARFDQIFPSLKYMKSTDRKVNIQSFRINKKQCEHCGNEINEVALIKHSIIPNDISKQLGLENVKTVDLCFTCHRAIHNWNAQRVSWVKRDKTNRSKAKSLIEVAEEYLSAHYDFFYNKLKHGYNPKQLLPQLSSV